ncbi:MAG: response regulator transcription factor [Kiritimatiellae bacterium]|nr:response regulator transcription factor [Kiritimatiellia bacterium]
MKKIRTLLADDHSLVRFGLESLLKFHKDFEVIGGAGDGEETVRLARELKPDVIVMDLVMPILDGVEATQRIHAELPDVRILILTSFGTSADVSRAIKAGASGALVKDIPNDELIKAIRAIAGGERVFSPEIERMALDSTASIEFTNRQMTVLSSLAKGMTNKEIATILGVSHSAVKQHLNAIFFKLGATNRSEAVAIAMRKYLLKF